MFTHSADYTLTESDFTRSAMIVVETNSNLVLPEKARGLNMVYIGSRGNPAFVAKIEIPSNAVENIRQQVELHADEDYHSIGALSEKVSWWGPEAMDVVLERRYTVGNSYVHTILCHDKQHFVLFIESMYL